MTDLAAILDCYFRGNSPPSILYIGIVNADGFTAFDPVNDDLSSHPGWTELVDYSESTRVQWTPGAVIGDSPASVNNPGGNTITPTANNSAIGVFLSDDNNKAGTTGQLIGPFYFENGTQDLITSVPFAINLNFSLKRNTPTG